MPLADLARITTETLAPHNPSYIRLPLGLAIGFWLGFDRLSGDTLAPMIVSLYAIPKLTLYPILLLAFGLGLSANVTFAAAVSSVLLHIDHRLHRRGTT